MIPIEQREIVVAEDALRDVQSFDGCETRGWVDEVKHDGYRLQIHAATVGFGFTRAEARTGPSGSR